MVDPSVWNILVCGAISAAIMALSIRSDNLHAKRIKKAVERRKRLQEAYIKDGASMIRREYEQEKNKVVYTQNIICKNAEMVQVLEDCKAEN